MKRINVIGTTGSGKTTFSKQLSRVLGVPYIQLDQLFWKPNWLESTDEEFFSKVTEAVSRDAWVLDGNYSRTNDIKWARADTVIWLDLNYFVTFSQLFVRTLHRAITKDELWPNTGNRESFRKSFFDSSSILIWFFKNYRSNRVKYLQLLQSDEYPAINFVHIKTRQEAKQFVDKIALSGQNRHEF